MRCLGAALRGVALGGWGVFVLGFAAASANDGGVSVNASSLNDSGSDVSDAALTFVAEPDAFVGDANGGVGWRFGDSGDSDGAEQSGRNVATLCRGSAVYSPEKRAVELDGARFELATPQAFRTSPAWTLVAVAEVREPLSIGVLASRDAAVPLVQLDVDENDRFRFIVRDVKGETVAACVPAPYRKPVFVAAVFETLDGKSRVRLTVGKETVESDATPLTFPVWGEKIQIGGLDFPGASFSWRGAISEVALLNGAASQAEVERLRDALTQKYALDLSPTSAPKAPDSWDVLATPRFDGTPDREVATDVCVVGAGSAGCAAAISAARAGANVVLIERQKRLGGTGTNAFVSNWEGGPGDEIARELFDRMKADGGAGVAKEHPHRIQAPTGFKMVDDAEPYENSLVRANPPEGGYRSVAFLPSAFDKAVREMLAETGRVEILDETTFFQAEKSADGTRVESVLARTLNGSVVRVKADVFVDSTGDVFLCRAVGCETFLGVDPKSRFGEIGAPDDATLATANGSAKGTTGGAETLRLNAIARCYLVEPRDKPKREIVAPSEQAPFPKCAYITGWIDGPRTVNMLTTLPGAALIELGYDEASRRSERIVRNHWSWLQSQPGFENYELVEIAPMLGIRESYRVKTSYVLVEADLAAGWNAQKHDDMIAVADHPCDIHGEGGTLSSVETAYGVPFRCLIPEPGPRNLLVACRGAGFSKIAASSCRLQRTMIQLGNAAGLAAAWAARDGVPVDAVDVGALTEKLDVRSRYPGLR